MNKSLEIRENNEKCYKATEIKKKTEVAIVLKFRFFRKLKMPLKCHFYNSKEQTFCRFVMVSRFLLKVASTHALNLLTSAFVIVSV